MGTVGSSEQMCACGGRDRSFGLENLALADYLDSTVQSKIDSDGAASRKARPRLQNQPRLLGRIGDVAPDGVNKSQATFDEPSAAPQSQVRTKSFPNSDKAVAKACVQRSVLWTDVLKDHLQSEKNKPREISATQQVEEEARLEEISNLSAMVDDVAIETNQIEVSFLSREQEQYILDILEGRATPGNYIVGPSKPAHLPSVVASKPVATTPSGSGSESELWQEATPKREVEERSADVQHPRLLMKKGVAP